MAILKVQFNDEIRRVTIEDDCTMSELTSKIRYMFPQLRNFVMSYMDSGDSWVEIKSNDDLATGIAHAKKFVPPIFRITIRVAEEEEVVSPTLPQEIEFNAPEVEKTETTNELISEETPATLIEEVASTPAVIEPITTSTTTTSSELCSFCKEDPVGYKCINCYNIVLCKSCEAQNIHNPAHLLVKLNKPVEALPIKQQLIFTQHIEGPAPSDRVAAKAQSKELRRVMREASARRKRSKEQRIRKERVRRAAKSNDKSVGVATNSAVIDVLPLVACESAVCAVAPAVEEEVSIQEEELTCEAPLDQTPQKAVGDFSVESRLLDEFLESLVLRETEEAQPQAPFEVVYCESDECILPEVADVEYKMEEVSDEDLPELVESNVQVEEVEEPVEEEEEEEEEVVEQGEDEEEETSWNLMGLLGSWRGNTGGRGAVNVNNYRIQGIAFQNKLDKLEAMGFGDRSRNMILLAKNLANLERTVEDLTC